MILISIESSPLSVLVVVECMISPCGVASMPKAGAQRAMAGYKFPQN
jgi:hypothetical protein